MSHRKSSRRGRMNRSRKTYRGLRFNARIFLIVLASLLLFAALAGLAVFVVFPEMQETLGIVKPSPTPVPSARPTPMPTPTPAPPLSTVDFEALTEVPELNEKYVSYPVFTDDGKLLYAGGDDGSKYSMMFLYDVQNGAYQDFESPELANDTLANIACNSNWIVYLDHSEKGGGMIMAMSRDSFSPFEVKKYYAGMPLLSLMGDTLVWIERTGSRMDKLFACDLNTLENVTLYTFSNSYYGLNNVSVDEYRIVWSDYDPEQSSSEARSNPKSTILTLQPGAPRPESYKPGVYVHDPLVNKSAIVWSDGNHSPDQKLYARMGSQEPTVVAEGVAHYALGNSFLAYCKDELLFLYSLADGRTVQLTGDGTRSILIGVYENRVLWYDITDEAAQGTGDILKFAVIPG